MPALTSEIDGALEVSHTRAEAAPAVQCAAVKRTRGESIVPEQGWRYRPEPSQNRTTPTYGCASPSGEPYTTAPAPPTNAQTERRDAASAASFRMATDFGRARATRNPSAEGAGAKGGRR